MFQFCLSLQDYDSVSSSEVPPWPSWISRVTNLSHFLLTLACSSNFYIYFAKHGKTVLKRFYKRRKKKIERRERIIT